MVFQWVIGFESAEQLPKSDICPSKLEVERHSILARNQLCIHWLKKYIIVNHISRSQPLLLVSTVTSNRYVGLLVAVNVGHTYTVWEA